MNPTRIVWRGIKIFSTVLIAAAIGRELLNGWAHILNLPQPIALLGRIALAAHGIEGAIAAVYAPSRGRSPLKYAIYTFFVGTLGLVELFQGQQGSNRPIEL